MGTFKMIFRILNLLLVVTAIAIHAEDDQEQVEELEIPVQEAQTDDLYREERDVIVLTDDNFDEVLKMYNVMLIEVYAPWCGHCKQLAPKYEEAAGVLKNAKIPVPLGKLDATVNTQVAERLGVSGYPTLKFWKDGNYIDYDGSREVEGIVQWVSEKADPDYKPPPSAVITVTKDNIDEFINQGDLVLLEFYAPWCGHCKRLEPEYEKAAQGLLKQDPPIYLGKCDATVETDLASKYGVTGYPTLKMFRKGKEKEYKGGRDMYGIMEYMTKQAGEAANLYPEMKDVKKSFLKGASNVIGFFDNLQDEKLESFKEIANDKREDFQFGYTLLEEARNLYKVNPGSLVVFTAEKFQTKFEPKYHILKLEDKTSDEISKFIDEKSLPLVGQYEQATEKFYNTYIKESTLCLAFYTVDWSFEHRDATQLWRKKVANIAKEYKDIKFAIANEEDYVDNLMAGFFLSDSGEEFNMGCFHLGKKYKLEPMDEFDEDEIKEFLGKMKKGKLSPQLKSQPIPKKNAGPVKTVVGNTFDKIVFDKSKDVLIEMYAPWCGHCKNLEPIYKDLGKAMKKEKNLVIAKIDATANDLPDKYGASGFPTIYFAPSNQKVEPLLYEGERTLEGFTKYLKEHATVSLGKNLKEEL